MKKTLAALGLTGLFAFALTGCMILGNFVQMPGFYDVLQFGITMAEIQKDVNDFTPENEYYLGRAVTANIFGKYRPL